jgi:aspartate aminotransferase
MIAVEKARIIPRSAKARGPVIPSGAMKIAARVQQIGESATLKVARKARELKAAGVDVVDLSVGEPDFPSPRIAVEAATRALEAGVTRYTANGGIPALREALAVSYRQRHGSPWNGEQVQVTVGAKMALFELAQALFEAGDEVILPAPYWVSLPEQIRLAGAEPVFVETSPEDGFRIHCDALLEAVTPRTRAVLVNSPCNPSGGVISAGDLRRLVKGCEERGLLLIADETYERFVYDDQPAVSAAAFAAEHPETVIVVGSFSKTYAMTGWRLGYAFGPTAVIGAIGKIQSHATSNPTSFAMPGAVAALEQGEEEWLERLAEYNERRRLLLPMLNDLPGFRCQAPAGAFYAFPDVTGSYREGRRDSVTVAEWLLEAARVAVVPGLAFGREGHVRISFACSREALREGVDRIREALAAS